MELPVPSEERHGLEPDDLTGATLGDPHRLAIDEHLTGTDAGEADHRRGWIRHHRTVVHAGTVDAQARDRSRPDTTEPQWSRRHIGVPSRIACRKQDVDPQTRSRLQQHRAPSAATTEDVDTELRGDERIDVIRGLGGPERERGPLDLEHPHGRVDDLGDVPSMEAACTPLLPFDAPLAHTGRLTPTPMTRSDRYRLEMSNHMKDRVIIVTGAGGGFGRKICLNAAGRGALIVGADIDPDPLDETIAMITTAGGSARGWVTDVRSADAMDALVASAVAAHGRVDVLINNAGTMPLAFFADHARAREAWDRCIDINFKGVLNGITAVHDQMITQGRGHVVNISSIYGNVATVGAGVYTATKAAVNILSETLRAESQGRIKVTNVRPTGVPGTNLGSGMVNGAAIGGILGQNFSDYLDTITAAMSGDLPESRTDPDSIGYWAITPEELADAVVHAIDQPWGIAISDITVRASGDLFLF
jgi:NADP-dependent 3-hydroxy acid dehydrogenase YdfG